MMCRDLLNGNDPGDIVSADGTGDAHLNGESAMRLETSRGYTLYYKPRDYADKACSGMWLPGTVYLEKIEQLSNLNGKDR